MTTKFGAPKVGVWCGRSVRLPIGENHPHAFALSRTTARRHALAGWNT